MLTNYGDKLRKFCMVIFFFGDVLKIDFSYVLRGISQMAH